jgi:hypothetical protein
MARKQSSTKAMRTLALLSREARAALSHALIDGRAVTEFEPAGKAADELRRLWKWIEEQTWRPSERR